MRKIFIMAVALMALTACEKVDLSEVIGADTEPNQQETVEYAKKFTFTVKGDFNNPDFKDAEEQNGPRKANSYMTADGTEMTDLWVIDYKDGEIKQQIHQTNTDENWGKPQMSLTLGDHHILFLASRGTEPVYQNGVVSWAKVLDTFYTDYEVTVTKTSNGNRAVTLNRIATKMQLYIEDAIPQGTTTLTFSPVLWHRGIDMLTGELTSDDNYDVTLSLPSSYIGAVNTSYNMWGLSSDEEWTTNITIVSKAGATVNAETTIPNAPFKANRTTIYRGNLYSDVAESSIELNSQWLTAYEGIY